MAEEADKEPEEGAGAVALVAPTQKEQQKEKVATREPTKDDRSFYVNYEVDDKGKVLKADILKGRGLEWTGVMLTSITGPTRHTNNATVVGAVTLRPADLDVRKKMRETSGLNPGVLLEVQRGMKIITRDGKEWAYMYGLVTHAVVKDVKGSQKLKERDISVFVPNVQNMFKTKLGSSRSLASR
jgi:hypothetical protein